MAKCTGRWFWVQYDAKWPGDFSYSVTIKGPQKIPGDMMPTHKDFSDVMKSVMAEYNRRGKTVQIARCDKGCDSHMLESRTPHWTGWSRVPFRRALIKKSGDHIFEFEVTGSLEIRKRIVTGVCIEKEL